MAPSSILFFQPWRLRSSPGAQLLRLESSFAYRWFQLFQLGSSQWCWSGPQSDICLCLRTRLLVTGMVNCLLWKVFPGINGSFSAQNEWPHSQCLLWDIDIQPFAQGRNALVLIVQQCSHGTSLGPVSTWDCNHFFIFFPLPLLSVPFYWKALNSVSHLYKTISLCFWGNWPKTIQSLLWFSICKLHVKAPNVFFKRMSIMFQEWVLQLNIKQVCSSSF